MDEVVALYDESGRPCGAETRSQVRARNLRHAATVVVVRDGLGRVYWHRRTDTKDVYPGLHDFACGGVITAGEDPHEAALRELAEELGIYGVTLEPLGEADYADDATTYRAFRYVTTWDGPVQLQADEVAWGGWATLDRVAAMLATGEPRFVPDTPTLLGDWLQGRLADWSEPEQGWDTHTRIVEGRWVDRTPIRPEVARQLLTETRLLPRLIDRLPLAVPLPVVLDHSPLRVRHRMVPGKPADPARLTAGDGALVGRFLRLLHDTGPQVYADAGVPPPEETRGQLLRFLAECADRVLPLLPTAWSGPARDLLAEAAEPTPVALVHGDLGPEHLLVGPHGVTGVIDWGDLRLADAGLDLAWTLHGTNPAFADALSAAYGVTPEQRRRGLVRHRLGPWFEAHWGVSGGPPEYAESGLAGIVARLAASVTR